MASRPVSTDDWQRTLERDVKLQRPECGRRCFEAYRAILMG